MSEPQATTESAPTDLDATARALIRLVGTAIFISDAIEHLPVEPILNGNAPFVIMLSVWRSGPMRPVQLGQIAGMTSGGTTKVIDRLEDAGLVTKTKDGDDADGRAVYVDVTDLGRTVAEQLLTELTPIVGDLTDDLNAITSEDAG